MKLIPVCVLASASLAFASAALAQGAAGTFALRVLTPEAALKATQAALAECRRQGYQVAVAVVDRSGLEQTLIRDRVRDFGWARASLAGQPSSGLRDLPRFVGLGGGMVIEAGGSIVGGIGVSGAPSGDADDNCAKAGISAIRDEIEM